MGKIVDPDTLQPVVTAQQVYDELKKIWSSDDEQDPSKWGCSKETEKMIVEGSLQMGNEKIFIEDYEPSKKCLPNKNGRLFPLAHEIVSVQPMTRPTGKIFTLDFQYRAATVEDYQCTNINDVEQDKHAIAFDAVEEDRKKNGTRFDKVIKIKCPICKGEMTYLVSSYNGHRSVNCDGCNTSVME